MQEYMAANNLTHSKDWVKIDPTYLEQLAVRRKVIATEPGTMVLWDSRTFHQNQYGCTEPGSNWAGGQETNYTSEPEERIVQYVCYLPRAGLPKAQAKKRLKYFEERRITSHWPYPVHVNPLQPHSYGENKITIDYSLLVPPLLEQYRKDIEQIL